MTLDAAVHVERGDLVLDAEVAVDDGEVLAVVGPNGAGKSTLVRVLAGLPVPQAVVRCPRLRIDDVDHRTTPAHGRGIGMTFQDLRLFPHLSAIDNVAYPLRARGTARRAARARAIDELASLGITEAVGRSRPAQLSGGEAQRVALARAVVDEPRVVLLDEPFAALDAAFRGSARVALGERLARVAGASVVVTHDVADALVLADRVLVLEEGRVTQVGSIRDVARRPATAYAARLVGTNLLSGHRRAGRVRSDGGLDVVAADPGPDGTVRIVVPPTAVALHRAAPRGSPRNAWPGVIASIESLGSRARVAVDLGEDQVVAEVTIAAVDELALRPGAPVWASVKATDVDVVTAAADTSPVW